MSSDSKIVIPQQGKGKYINWKADTPYNEATPLGGDVRLNQMSASLARLQASVAALEAVGAAINNLVVYYDGSTPEIIKDTFTTCSVVKTDSKTITITSSAKFTNPLFPATSYGDLNWSKTDTSTIVITIPDDYTGFPFVIKFWEESLT